MNSPQLHLREMDIKITVSRLPWWSNGYDSMLPMQGTQVQSLVRELDPTCCMNNNNINKLIRKKNLLDNLNRFSGIGLHFLLLKGQSH